MKPEDAEEYTQALGQVVAGGWRQIALGQRLGVPQALNLSVDEWVKSRLGGYVRLSVEERREAARALKDEGHTQREIGRVLGVDPGTVNKDLKAVENSTRDEETSANGSHLSQSVVENSTAAGPTLAEQADTLRVAIEHLDNVRTLHRDHPECFAADEIYDSLIAEVEHLQTWIPSLSPEHPGRSGPGEWQELLQRLQHLTARLAGWYTESFIKEMHT